MTYGYGKSVIRPGRVQPVQLTGALPLPPVGHYFDTGTNGKTVCRYCGRRPL